MTSGTWCPSLGLRLPLGLSEEVEPGGLSQPFLGSMEMVNQGGPPVPAADADLSLDRATISEPPGCSAPSAAHTLASAETLRGGDAPILWMKSGAPERGWPGQGHAARGHRDGLIPRLASQAGAPPLLLVSATTPLPEAGKQMEKRNNRRQGQEVLSHWLGLGSAH